jgi:uncharacterized HAD superfamily protein
MNKDQKNILIDIDGTVSDDIPNEQEHLFPYAKVLKDSVDSVNKLYDDNHIITFFTARREKDREVTEKWLNDNGFKYHSLLMNKPRGGNYIWIDNLSVNGILYKDNWTNIINSLSK